MESNMQLFVMTGEIQSGKTTWIKRMLAQAQARGLSFSGVYTPAVFEGGTKTAIDAVLLPQQERLRLAHFRDGACPDGVHRLAWEFDEAAMARCNGHLGSLGHSRLLLIDELGPLELVRNEGYTQALELLDSRQVECALVVIRPSLLEVAQNRWGSFEQITPETDIDNFIRAVGKNN